jgi:hypothetical protein
MPQIFEDDVRHGHAKRRGKILFSHSLLFCAIREKTDETFRQIPGVAGLVELNRHAFAIGHLAKIFEIRTHDGHSIGACQVRHPTASGGGRVGHHRD